MRDAGNDNVEKGARPVAQWLAGKVVLDKRRQTTLLTLLRPPVACARLARHTMSTTGRELTKLVSASLVRGPKDQTNHGCRVR